MINAILLTLHFEEAQRLSKKSLMEASRKAGLFFRAVLSE